MKRTWDFWPVALFVTALIGFALLGCGGGGAGTTGGGNGGNNGGNNGGGGAQRITGQVRHDANGAVSGVTVRFFLNDGTVIASGQTNAQGVYDIPVTTLPQRMEIVSSSIPGSLYYRVYRFQGLWYQPSIANCRAALPALAPGVSNTLPNILIPLRTGPPPPPPTGCGT